MRRSVCRGQRRSKQVAGTASACQKAPASAEHNHARYGLNLRLLHRAQCQCSSAWLEHSPCKRKVAGSDPVIGSSLIRWYGSAWRCRARHPSSIALIMLPAPQGIIERESLTMPRKRNRQTHFQRRPQMRSALQILLSQTAKRTSRLMVAASQARQTKAPPKKTATQRRGGGRSSSRGLYAALIATVGVAAFFAGLAVPVLNQDPITMSDLNQAVVFLEDKIDKRLQRPPAARGHHAHRPGRFQHLQPSRSPYHKRGR